MNRLLQVVSIIKKIVNSPLSLCHTMYKVPVRGLRQSLSGGSMLRLAQHRNYTLRKTRLNVHEFLTQSDAAVLLASGHQVTLLNIPPHMTAQTYSSDRLSANPFGLSQR